MLDIHVTVTKILQQARSGSTEALGELLRVSRQYLLMVANQELDAKLTAKMGGSDLVQDAFLLAHERFDSFNGDSEAELRGWLRKILLNRLGSRRRRFVTTEKRRVSRERSLDGSRGALARLVACPQASPCRQAIEREHRRLLNSALQELPEPYRRVIELHHREQLSFEEVARKLGINPATARQRWVRAIKRLQAAIPSPNQEAARRKSLR